jgi:KaiC/GvpD/RAD55 family RecA-like ATPase
MADVTDDPTLVDPDGDEGTKYSWDEEFQRHVAALLISDRMFLLQSLDLVKPGYFTNKAHAKVVGIAYDFFKKYRILPRRDFIIQELKTQLKEHKSLPYYLGETKVIFDYFQPGMEARDYLRDKITYFAKIQSLKQAFHKSLELIDKSPEDEKTWDTIYDKMRDAMTTHQNFDVGIDYFKSVKDRYAKKAEEVNDKDRFILGLDGIDLEVSGGGYCRGEIISIVAGSGVGKSVMLANVAKTNILRGKKCVYISLELAEHKIADRMDAIFTGLPVQNLMDHKDAVFEKLTALDGIDRPDGEDKLWPMVIKQFPAGTATVNTVRAYLSQLRFHGFDPDLVIIDYVGEMALHPDIKSYESREKTVRELRAMAVEENVFVATAMQPNRDAKKDGKAGERHRIDDDHLADAYGQIRPLDGCISLNQNDTEKLLGIGRGYVIKQRDGKSRYQIYLRFDKESLRITEITQNEYKLILSNHKEVAAEDVNVDMVADKVDKAKKGGWKPPKDELDTRDIDSALGEVISSFPDNDPE